MGIEEVAIPLPQLSERRRRAARRARRLRLNDWETLRFLPALCRDMGVRTPEWARHLLEHATAVSYELPVGVIDGFVSLSTIRVATCESPAARQWGITMGLWVPLHPPSSRARVIESGLETAESAAASLVFKTFGHLVRKLWIERNPDEVKCSRGDLLAPFDPFVPGEAPEVIEDGTKGVITFKFETEDAGPAWLHRDGRSERLFSGRWVEIGLVEEYAHGHGHLFQS